MFLPNDVTKVKIPPIKIQGIKSKLLPFIAGNISWDGEGTYFEPFMGSGVVGFNLAPEKAVFSDINPHLINFYRAVQSKEVTALGVRNYLECEAVKLSETPENRDSYFYEVRDRFNKEHNPYDFLFLQRSNFNGMMRFNSKGEYNVPFCRKPNRFAPALITKIVNQVAWTQQLFASRPLWSFEVVGFEEMFSQASRGDFFYLDPPYIDRHDTYFCEWSQDLADSLAMLAQSGEAGYALSMWKSNKYRVNTHLEKWSNGVERTTEHFYHVGAKESNRNMVVESLILSPENVAAVLPKYQEVVEIDNPAAEELTLF